MKASIVIPTVDRRSQLRDAVRGCLGQHLPREAFEIVVVDNSPGRSQHWIVEEFQGQPGSERLRLVGEPVSGLSQARNAGIAAAAGEFVVFLDDDESPSSTDWLAELLSAIETAGADAAFGPVYPAFGAPPQKYLRYIEDLYTRDLDRPHAAEVSGLMHLLGSGNSCFRVASCFPSGGEVFKTQYNLTGGEDTELIRRLALAGKRLVWAPRARVAEHVPEDRMAFAYLCARRFAQGQMRTAVNMAGAHRRYDRILFWMFLGAGQFGLHRLAALFSRVFGRREAADIHAIQSYGGLGKVLWHRSFRRARYGATASG